MFSFLSALNNFKTPMTPEEETKTKADAIAEAKRQEYLARVYTPAAQQAVAFNPYQSPTVNYRQPTPVAQQLQGIGGNAAAPSYDQYLQNLMGGLNPQGGMLTQQQMPSTYGIQQALNNVQNANVGYTPIELSYLPGVRDQALAEYKAKKEAEDAANKKTSTLDSVVSSLIGGSGSPSIFTNWNGESLN